MDQGTLLKGARVYLSGPMDFVPSRKEEKKSGWRKRLRDFLQTLGAVVYDPWAKPIIVGQDGFGKNYEYANDKRLEWTFEDSEQGAKTRAHLCQFFYPTVHINQRLVDICDFLIAYCPTNIYSVGTVNEVIRAREQHKPVLLVSPPVKFPILDDLTKYLEEKYDLKALEFLAELKSQLPVNGNPDGTPSPWYLALINGDYFFDGFGFAPYANKFKWLQGRLDQSEQEKPPKRPLLPYLEKLSQRIPKRYDAQHDQYIENSDWMILEPGQFEPD